MLDDLCNSGSGGGALAVCGGFGGCFAGISSKKSTGAFLALENDVILVTAKSPPQIRITHIPRLWAGPNACIAPGTELLVPGRQIVARKLVTLWIS